jgi:glycerophosphoryl diester phosphodiesterase
LNFFTKSALVGHRGDRASHPDNSLAGIASGLAAVGAVEVDVRLSGDGRLVLAHDAVVAGLDVATTPWRQMPALGLLDEAMGIPGRFDLEVKNLPGEPGFDQHGRLALAVASRARSLDVVTSFYWPDMDRVARRAPWVDTGLLVGEDGSLDDAIEHARSHGHRVVAAHHSLVDPDSVARQTADGDLHLMVWTLDEPERAVALLTSGVAAVVTDQPSMMSTFIREMTSG